MTLKEASLHNPQKGLLIKIVENPAILYMAKDLGMDFVFYDCEHGVIPYRSLHDVMLLGNSIGIPSIVRTPQLARRDVSQILDYGATGVMVPMIETKQQAQQLVDYSKYPPLGKRSYSGGANTLYGPSGNHAQHMHKMNEETITIVQIETKLGIENIDDILSVEGIDAVIVGPCDLGISINNPDNVMDKEELALIQRVQEACRTHHKSFGIIGGNTLLEQFKGHITWLVSAIDTNLLRDGIHKAVQDYEKLIQGGRNNEGTRTN